MNCRTISNFPYTQVEKTGLSHDFRRIFKSLLNAPDISTFRLCEGQVVRLIPHIREVRILDYTDILSDAVCTYSQPICTALVDAIFQKSPDTRNRLKIPFGAAIKSQDWPKAFERNKDFYLQHFFSELFSKLPDRQLPSGEERGLLSGQCARLGFLHTAEFLTR